MHCYIINNINLKVEDVIFVNDYDIEFDEETNIKSIITLSKKPKIINQNFYILIKNKKISYFGVIVDPISDKKTSTIQITCKDISNIFNRKIILSHKEEIESHGIEYFIANTIKREFINSDDLLLNYNYIEVDVKTSTKQNVVIETQDDIYNFHTFITNCRQKYNVFMDFEYLNEKLVITIEKRNLSSKLIDATTSDIRNYKKVYETNVTSKVTVKCGDTNNIKSWFLRDDRTITEDIDDPKRIYGDIETIYVSQESAAYESALNIFKGNRYNHLVEFEIKSDTKLFDTSMLKIGVPLKLKTDEIIETYISAITYKNNSNFYKIKTGNIRIDMLSKQLQKTNQSMNKLDKTGGNINGMLIINGGVSFGFKKIVNVESII